MKELLLTQGKVALLDDEDFERFSIYRFCAIKNSNGNYYARASSKIFFDKPRPYLAALVMNKVSDKKFVIHFKNRNTLDCRKENLEVLEKGLALQKRGKMSKTPSSKYIGVYLEQVKGMINPKWVVRVAYKGLKSSVGRFDTEKEAALFYNKKMIELWGEGARLNVITDE